VSTFEYLWPVEVFDRLDDPRGYRRTRGRRVADATWCTRTNGGRARRPELHGREHAYLPKFRTLDRVERVTGDANPGTFELFFTDGTSGYVHADDLVCVERPILPVHYGEVRTACGNLGKYDTVTTNIPSVTCGACTQSVNATV
jgi:hypothetical protein